jgi:hypothetical protein
MIELRQTPIYKSQLRRACVTMRNLERYGDLYLAPLVIYHNIVRLHVTMHDAFGMTEIQRLPE